MLRQGAHLVFSNLRNECAAAVDHYGRLAPRSFGRQEPIGVTEIVGDAFNIFKHTNEDQKLVISLDTECSAVFVDRGNKPLLPTFMVDLSGTAFVLKYEGRTISPEDAVEIILDPLLFADLPQTFPSASK